MDGIEQLKFTVSQFGSQKIVIKVFMSRGALSSVEAPSTEGNIGPLKNKTEKESWGFARSFRSRGPGRTLGAPAI